MAGSETSPIGDRSSASEIAPKRSASEDTAMGISPATVQREWRLARAWLQRELQA